MSDAWYKEFCPECDAINWWTDGNLDDVTIPDTDGIKCRSCAHQWLFEGVEEMHKEMGEPIDINESYIIDGTETPT